MTTLLSRLSEALSGQLEKPQKRMFLESCMAASAIVAMADREVRLVERLALDHVLESVEQLRKFDPNVAVNMHRAFVTELAEDYDAGKTRLLKLLSRHREQRYHAELIIKIGTAIARAGNQYTDLQAGILREICEAVDIPVEATEIDDAALGSEFSPT